MTVFLLPPAFLSCVSGRGVSVGMSLFPSIFAVTTPVSQVRALLTILMIKMNFPRKTFEVKSEIFYI